MYCLCVRALFASLAAPSAPLFLAHLLSQQRSTLRACGFLPHSQSMWPKVLKVLHTVASQSPISFSRLNLPPTHRSLVSRCGKWYGDLYSVGRFFLCPSLLSVFVQVCCSYWIMYLLLGNYLKGDGFGIESIPLMLCNMSQKYPQSSRNVRNEILVVLWWTASILLLLLSSNCQKPKYLYKQVMEIPEVEAFSQASEIWLKGIDAPTAWFSVISIQTYLAKISWKPFFFFFFTFTRHRMWKQSPKVRSHIT